MRGFKPKTSIDVILYIIIATAASLLLKIFPSIPIPKWNWELISWKALATVALFSLSVFFAWLLLKIFPSLIKLNRKIITGLFIFFKILDAHSTHLCIVKTRNYEAELNIVFPLFFKIFKLEAPLAMLTTNIFATLFGALVIKILIDKNYRFWAFFLLIAVLLAVINNYLSYFLLVA